MGATTVRLAKAVRTTFEPVPLPDIRHDPEIVGHRGALRADHRRPHRAPRAASREAPAVRAVQGADGLDDARAHDPRRRHVGVRGARREQVPAPLDLRRRRRSSRPRSGSPTSRTGTATRSASTRPGATRLEGARHRGRDRARARALHHDHAQGRQARDPHDQEGQAPRRAGRVGERALPPPRRRARGAHRRRADRRGRARRDPRRACRARGRRSARRRSRRRPRAGSRSRDADQIDRAALLALAEKHRRETK